MTERTKADFNNTGFPQRRARKTGNAFQSRKIKRGFFIAGMTGVGVIQFLIFWVYVNFNSILMAFQTQTRTGISWGFENFTRFFHEMTIPELELSLALKNTLLLFFVGTVLGLPSSLLFAYYLYKKVRWSGFFRVVFFLPSIISAAVLVGLFKYVMAMQGPVNGFLSVLLGRNVEIEWLTDDNLAMKTILFYVFWTGFGGNIVLLTGAIHRISPDILEYAQIDGVGMTRELLQIIVPLIWPTLSTMIVLAVAGLFTNSGPILLFTEGQFRTMTIGYFIFDQVQSGQYYYPSAIGLVFTAIGFPLVMLVKRGLSKIADDVEY